MLDKINEFAQNMESRFSNAGKKWLEDLPKLVGDLVRKWELTDLNVAPNLTYNYVIFAKRNNKPVVLKIGFDKEEVQTQVRAMNYFKSIQLIEYEDHAILMERCLPGTLLESFVPHEDEMATDIGIDVLKSFYKPAQEGFPHLSNWFKVLDQDLGLPKDLLEKARKTRDYLFSTSTENIVLHGDFHHGNILQNGDQFVAIDMHGVIGEPGYDIACFVRNPLKEVVKNFDLIPRRIQQFSKAFGIPKIRLKQWCLIQSILSACWRVEDNQDPTDYLLFCEYVSNMLL